MLPALTTDPFQLGVAAAAIHGISNAEEIFMKASPYFQAGQNEILNITFNDRFKGEYM